MELYNIYHSLDTSPVKMAEYSPYKNETVNKYMDEALAAEDLEESIYGKRHSGTVLLIPMWA